METLPAVASNLNRPTDEIRRRCRLEFVQGKGSGPEVAKRNRVSYSTLRQWAFREDWQGLKERREELEIAKLNEGLLPAETMPIPEVSQIQILTAHLKRIDESLRETTDARDIVNLMRARHDCQVSLHLEKHGVRPGVAKTSGKQARKAPVQIIPQLVTPQDQLPPT